MAASTYERDGATLHAYPNGYGARIWCQLGTEGAYEAQVVTAGPFGVVAASSRLVGLWEWQLSGLTRARVDGLLVQVEELPENAEPVTAGAMHVPVENQQAP